MREEREREKKDEVRRGQQTESVETGKALSISENRLIKTGKNSTHTHTHTDSHTDTPAHTHRGESEETK